MADESNQQEQHEQQQAASTGDNQQAHQQAQQPMDVLSPEAKRILKKEREEARVAERKRVEEEYGVPAEEARRIIAEARQREESQQTEVQKAHKQVQKAEQERDAANEERDATYAYLAEMKQEDALSKGLLKSGLNPQYINIAIRSANTDLMDIDGDGNVSGVEDAVSAIREESPVWFSDTQEAQPHRAPDASTGRVARYGERSDTVKSFNDRLRVQGLRNSP